MLTPKIINTDYAFSAHGLDDLPATPHQGKIPTYKGAFISITNKCNTDHCEYCYARSESHLPPMSLDNFTQALDWLVEMSDFPEIGIVGGEPTGHPQLIDFLDAIAQRNWQAKLYTNGFFGKNRCQELANHPALKRVAFHYEPSILKLIPKYQEQFVYNVELLASRKECSLSFIINEPQFQFEELVQLATQHGTAIGWTFAAPTAGDTPYMDLQTLRGMAPHLQKFLLTCLEKNIQTAPDVAVPLCAFDEAFLKQYDSQFKIIRKCRPFVYIRADLSTQYCTAISKFTTPRVNSANEVRQAVQLYREHDLRLKQQFSFPECVACPDSLKQFCQGGCQTYKIYGTHAQASSSSADAYIEPQPIQYYSTFPGEIDGGLGWAELARSKL